MTNQLKRSIFLCACIFCTHTSFSQITIVDTALKTPAALAALSVYQNVMSTQYALYDGLEYTFPSPNITGSPFYMESKDWHKGWVTFEGIKYDGVPMRYDVFKNQLVIVHYNGISTLYLINDKVSDFSFEGNNFLNFKAGQTATMNLTPGYYRALYTGRSKIMGKYKAEFQSMAPAIGSTIIGEFRPIKRYYALVGNTYIEFKNAKNLFGIFKSKSKELRQYVKTNQIDLNDDPERAMVSIATEYDRITK